MPENPSIALTRGIRVEVTSEYLPRQSDAAEERFVFAYSIRIANESDATVQLRSRHWRILHGTGKEEEVRGPGVVGEQPVLAPGSEYRYSSGCILTTPHGTMQGTYQMACATGSSFDVDIPAFSLSAPHTLN